MATLLLRVPDLEPERVERLERLLRSMPGVFGVVVSAAEGCAEVDFEDDEGDLDVILLRLRDEGFDARVSG